MKTYIDELKAATTLEELKAAQIAFAHETHHYFHDINHAICVVAGAVAFSFSKLPLCWQKEVSTWASTVLPDILPMSSGSAPTSLCPCGIARQQCVYHKP